MNNIYKKIQKIGKYTKKNFPEIEHMEICLNKEHYDDFLKTVTDSSFLISGDEKPSLISPVCMYASLYIIVKQKTETINQSIEDVLQNS